MFTDIHYFITLPDTDRNDHRAFTPFQGISTSLPRRICQVRPILEYWPPNVIELYRFSLGALSARLAGMTAYRIMPIDISNLLKVHITDERPFVVLFVDSETSVLGNQWVGRQSWPILTIDTDDEGSYGKDTNLVQQLIDHCDAVIDNLTSHPQHEELTRLRGDARKRDTFDVGFPALNHNSTAPNELALCSIGGQFDSVGDPLVGDDEKFVAAITRSADAVNSVLRQLGPTPFFEFAPPVSSLIVTAPAFYKDVLEDIKDRSAAGRRILKYLRLLWRQRTYSVQLDNVDEAEFKAMLDSPEFRFVTQIRTEELTAYTAAIAVRAASYLSPVLRLPPAVNHVSTEITRLADCIRANPESRKVCRLANQLFEKLDSSIHEEYRERISGHHSSITLISDAPLEWMRIDGVPLMFRHTTSRIPVTPGNVAIGEILPHEQVNLTLESFQETLVLRSFDSSDSVREELERTLKFYRRSDGSSLPVRFVDVRNREEFVSAISDFDGAMVVLDSHGSHSRREDIGRIHLVEETIDVWQLRGVTQFPPIMFLCACDTHALDRSHATVANGLATCGVRSVVSTILPVRSFAAAASAARYLFRIYEFLPAVAKANRTIRWDEVYSQFQRMEFVSEILRMLVQHTGIELEDMRATHERANMLCHNRSADWYEDFLGDVSATFDLSVSQIESLRRKHLAFPECQKYVHLGNPGSILVLPPARDDRELDVADMRGGKDSP